MISTRRFSQTLTALASFALLAGAPSAFADEHMAKNVIAVTTGSIPNDSDPRIYYVSRQLDRIQRLCAGTSRGADIGDKIAFAHSKLRVQQAIFPMLDGFETIATRQCGTIDSAQLLGLYVLERNDGISHAQAVKTISTRPGPIIKKWTSRPAR